MKNLKIGLQLFSIQDEMFKDTEGTLKAVAEMGYECVEFARDLFGHSAEEIKKLCEKYGLEPISAHHNFSEMLENPDLYMGKFKTFRILEDLQFRILKRLDVCSEHVIFMMCLNMKIKE